MNETDFVNVYIEKILTEVTELNKTKLLLQAKLSFTEKLAETLQKRVIEMEAANSELEEKLQKAKKKQPVE